ncbi:MAG: gluconokinase [Clostridiales bacterium]|nr:gluconokinase [Clostridiales bacterium]MDK2933152.1 gluconokinase [Clostridiales bacterium]
MNILAIEVSTSSAKALIYSSDEGEAKHVLSIPYGKEICDVVSQDAEGIYQTLVQCIKKVMQLGNYRIDALSICTTWHSLLFLDQNRKPMGRILTWADTDAGETARKYRKDSSLTQKFYNKTGCMVHSIYALWKYIHIRDNEPEKLRNVAYISTQQDYIFEKLTGEAAISQCVASGTGFFNIHTLDWDEEILAFANIQKKQLPVLKEPTYTAPLRSDVAKELNLPSGIPVILGGADGALNQIGAGALQKGIMTLSVGTSGALRIASDQPILPENPSTWCYYAAQGKRVAGAATSGAGNCVEWFVKKANYNRADYRTLDNLIDAIDKKEAPIFLPFLYGERCPGWHDNRTGGFIGVKGSHDVGHLYYSVLEGILFHLYQCYEILIKVGNTPDQIRISGGITNSPQWLQMAADIFQKEIYISEIEHASTMGAVILALKAVGALENLEQFKPEAGEKILPNQEMAQFYKVRYRKYIEGYEKL